MLDLTTARDRALFAQTRTNLPSVKVYTQQGFDNGIDREPRIKRDKKRACVRASRGLSPLAPREPAVRTHHEGS